MGSRTSHLWHSSLHLLGVQVTRRPLKSRRGSSSHGRAGEFVPPLDGTIIPETRPPPAHPFVYEILFRNMGTKAIPGYKQPPWQLLVHLDWANGSTQLIPHDMTKEILPGDAVLIRGFTLVRAPGVFYVKVGYPFHKRWEDEDKKRQSLQHGEEIVWVGTRVAIDEATYLQRRNLRVTAVGIVATVVATLVAIFLLR